MFCTTYLENIIIYSYVPIEHIHHVRKVLDTLESHAVLLKPEKCEFNTKRTIFIDLIIFPKEITTDPAKVKAGQE